MCGQVGALLTCDGCGHEVEPHRAYCVKCTNCEACEKQPHPERVRAARLVEELADDVQLPQVYDKLQRLARRIIEGK